MPSLWDRTQALPNESFKQVENGVYGDNFPFEVRFQLAVWIEENFFNQPVEVKQEDPGSANLVIQLAQQLLIQLESHIQSIPNDPDKILMKRRLEEMQFNLKTRYNSNLAALYMQLRQCLEKEAAIVNLAANSVPGSIEQSKDQKIRHSLSTLKQRSNSTNLQLEQYRNEQELVTSEIYSFREADAKLQQYATAGSVEDVKRMKPVHDKMKASLEHKFNGLCTARNAILGDIVFTVNEVKTVQHTVLDEELINWKREQQLAGNGKAMSMSLETLQEWCEALATVIWSTRQHIKDLERLMSSLPDSSNPLVTIKQLATEVTELLSSLVTGTFIIEKQPPQVMKTNTRFTATVRLLVGGQLNVHMASPQVSVSIISEAQANLLLKAPNQSQKRKEDYNSGEILNGQGNMEFHAATRQVSVTFRNLQLKRIRRTEKKGTESVMEEKFSVLFWTEFQVNLKLAMLWFASSFPLLMLWL